MLIFFVQNCWSAISSTHVVPSEGILLVNKEVKEVLEGDSLVLLSSNMSGNEVGFGLTHAAHE